MLPTKEAVVAAVLKRLTERFDYIDIASYTKRSPDDPLRFDDETWEEIATVAAEAALAVVGSYTLTHR